MEWQSARHATDPHMHAIKKWCSMSAECHTHERSTPAGPGISDVAQSGERVWRRKDTPEHAWLANAMDQLELVCEKALRHRWKICKRRGCTNVSPQFAMSFRCSCCEGPMLIRYDYKVHHNLELSPYPTASPSWAIHAPLPREPMPADPVVKPIPAPGSLGTVPDDDDDIQIISVSGFPDPDADTIPDPDPEAHWAEAFTPRFNGSPCHSPEATRGGETYAAVFLSQYM